MRSYMAPEPGNELPPGTVPSRRPFFAFLARGVPSPACLIFSCWLRTAGEEVHDGIKTALEKHAPGVNVQPLDRFAFYDRADKAFAIVQCVGERVRSRIIPLACCAACPSTSR